jgi:hypothetical protein
MRQHCFPDARCLHLHGPLPVRDLAFWPKADMTTPPVNVMTLGTLRTRQLISIDERKYSVGKLFDQRIYLGLVCGQI